MLIKDDAEFSFNHAGLFVTDREWIHPKVKQSTYEIIFVIKGVVHIYEDEHHYSLQKNDILLLDADKIHYGYKPSFDPTSFYWVHFRCNCIEKLNLPKVLNNFDEGALFKEILHYHRQPEHDQFITDSILAHIFAKLILKSSSNSYPKIVSDIYEWTKINANATLSVTDIAEHFGYTPEHISRIMKKHYSTSMKSLINNFIINRANALLCNSNYTIKEIANILQFYDYNAFVKFYKYHEKTSPTKYRNKYSNTYMNNK